MATTRIISFSGLDGCGKTTLIESVRKEIESHGLKTNYVWLRFNHYLTRIFHGFCRLAGYTRYDTHKGIRIGYHEFYRSQFISWMAIILNFVDTLLATILYVYLPLLFTRRIILCDRWAFDIVVDLAVDSRRSLLPTPWWAQAFIGLLPSSSASFLILRNQENLVKARPELVFDRNYQLRCQMFKEIAKYPCIISITNDNTIPNTVREIISHIKLPLP
jgi:hypothetical protein